MLALPPLRSRGDAEYLLGEMEDFSSGNRDQFLDFPEGNLLDCINFDDIFAGIDDDGDVLPDLEMVDPEILADFAAGANGGEESEVNASAAAEKVDDESSKDLAESSTDRDESVEVKVTASIKEGSSKGGKKSTGVQSKNNIGKRKVKVDWTPELHRKFVQAVEQLGLDKAVPSKILELMGIDCLTRHNIASHLQKYRSQRKHMQAREVEAANWSQRRQMYGSTAVASKRVVAAGPWLSGVVPTMGFPPMAPPPPIQHHQFPRPLHVWGHPTVDRQLPWPKPMVHSPPLPRQPLWPVAPAYPLPPPPPDPCSYWHPHQHQISNPLTHGTPCFSPSQGFSTAPVPGIPPPTMYKDEHSNTIPNSQSSPQLPIDFHPSNESIDAAIGDALTKPWQPLPLGLRPPSLDSVLMELHRQGIPKIPPFSA